MQGVKERVKERQEERKGNEELRKCKDNQKRRKVKIQEGRKEGGVCGVWKRG